MCVCACVCRWGGGGVGVCGGRRYGGPVPDYPDPERGLTVDHNTGGTDHRTINGRERERDRQTQTDRQTDRQTGGHAFIICRLLYVQCLS